MNVTKAIVASTLALAFGSLALPAGANIVFTGNGNSENSTPGHKVAVSAQAEFDLTGSLLTLLLTNTSGDTAKQGDALTGIVFNITGDQTLAFDMTGPTCGQSLGAGSKIWTDGSSSTTDSLCGSWTSVLAAVKPIPAEFGVATTGFNGEFNGGSITRGDSSPNYGIVGDLTFPGSIGGSKYPFIQNQAQFAFNVTSGNFLESDIKGVTFLFGTDGTAGVAGKCVRNCTFDLPEPPPFALLGLGALALAFTLRKRKASMRA
jgi:MYXO-CTERM domain-containing protein